MFKKIFYLIGLLSMGCAPMLVTSADTTPPPLPAPAVSVATLTPTPTPTPTLTPTSTATFTPTPSVASSTSTPTPENTLTPTRPPRPPATATPVGHYVRAPILMYHHIAIPPENADAIRRDLSVWPERFEEQLAYFASQGYHSVLLQDVYDAVTQNKPLPAKPLVLTFDDGYDDNYLNAFPLLQKYHYTGTFYIPTGLLERPGYMTWEQVVALSKAGMDIQSHSITHPALPNHSADFIRKELVESKRALERMTGKPVLFFCYPGGAHNALTMQILQESGYLSATTTQPGAKQYAVAPYLWPRVRVRGADTLGDLINRLRELGVRY